MNVGSTAKKIAEIHFIEYNSCKICSKIKFLLNFTEFYWNDQGGTDEIRE